MADRLQREHDFHNQAYEERRRASVGKYYAITRRAFRDYCKLVGTKDSSKSILEIGCGAGTLARILSQNGAHVIGVDLSEVAIEQAQREVEGYQTNAEFRVMNAEQLDFDVESFDLICGTGVLHHLVLDKAFQEIKRVLRPGGTAVFYEPLGHNPLINLFRRLTPHLRSEDEHPLRMKDLKIATQYFTTAETRFYCLFALLALPFHRLSFFSTLLALLDRLDVVVFRLFPFIRRYAWIVVIKLTADSSSASSYR